MKIIEGKVVLLGSQGVGKTSLITRYVNKTFNPHINPTIGASFFTCKINLDDARVKIQVWDTAGQERFRSMAPMYYRNSNAAILVFDITQPNTFAAIQSWVTELKRNVEEPMVLVLVGNKVDLAEARKVETDECAQYAEAIGAAYFEVSALNDDGVDRVFLAVALGLLRLTGEGDRDVIKSLRIYDSQNSEISDVPLSEEVFNTSIAHGIHEKPYFCC